MIVTRHCHYSVHTVTSAVEVNVMNGDMWAFTPSLHTYTVLYVKRDKLDSCVLMLHPIQTQDISN